jgi:hypothetical protein
MPNPTIRPLGNVASKWKRRAGSAGEEYRTGVETTAKDWASSAGAAEPAYKAGVTAAATAGRFGKGIIRAGSAKWKQNAAQKGPMRFSQGVEMAEGDYQKGFAPFHEAIGRTDLPQRGPRGSESNYARVSGIGKALHQLKNTR